VVPHTRKTYSGPLEVGEDLMTIETKPLSCIPAERAMPTNPFLILTWCLVCSLSATFQGFQLF
jgi:hypothetical protein